MLIQHIMANRVDPDQFGFRNQLIWIYTVCKGRVDPGLGGFASRVFTFQILDLREPHNGIKHSN